MRGNGPSPLQLAHEIAEAVNTKDFERLARCYHPDAISINAGVEMRGRDAIVRDQQKEFEQFPDSTVTIVRALEGPTTAAYEVTFTGTNTGPIRTPGRQVIPATGRAVSFQMSIWLEVEDGMVRHDRRYYDQLAVLGELGLLGR